MVQMRAEDKGLSLNLDIDKDIPEGLCGDEIRIKHDVIFLDHMMPNIHRFV